MSTHPGAWLCQTQLNASQTILTWPELSLLQDISVVDLSVGDALEQMVYVRFFAGGFSFWAAAVDWETGVFTGFSRNRLIGPTENWKPCTHEVLQGIQLPFKVNGAIVRIPLERDTRFKPKTLRDALLAEIIG